jgi:hypothetical protein
MTTLSVEPSEELSVLDARADGKGRRKGSEQGIAADGLKD